MRSNMTKMVIEMIVPVDMDSSELLAQMQEIAVAIAEAHLCDSDGESIEVSDALRSEIEDAVSVQEVR